MSELSDYYAKRFKTKPLKRFIKIHLRRADEDTTPCGRWVNDVRSSYNAAEVTCLICKRVK